MIRLLLFVAAFPLASFAQLQLYLFDGTHETPIGTSYDVGSAAPGDTIETRFRVRNLSTAAITLQTITISGAGFTIETMPSLPYILAPDALGEADFRTAFSPTQVGPYTATLAVNNLTVAINAVAVASAALYLAGSKTPLMSGATIDFGSALRGTSKLQAFLLANNSSAALQVNSLSVTGAGFHGPIGLTAPVQLGPGVSMPFQIAFEPQVAQPAQGTLSIDQRSFQLTGLGLDPPLPSAAIMFDSSTAVSAQQLHVSIVLASASQIAANGTLTLAFHPSITGVTDDAAVQFLSGPPRIASVTISPGDTVAKFDGQPNLAFQTGTTAGTITFTLTLPNETQQASVTIAPAEINIDATSGVRRIGDLDVSIIGFDNTHSTSELAFTFFDTNGNTVAPGAIRVDETADFQNYFNSGQFGGAFALSATFPVTGNVNQIATVQVQMTNSAGTIQTQRIVFQ